MSEALESINGLIVPLLNDPLLLPNVAVAELVGYRLSQAANQGPEWFLGWTQWRDQPVPMVDLDALRAQGGEPADGAQPRTLILNALGGSGAHFIGLRVWGIPRSRRLLREELQSLEGPSSYQLQRVSVSDEPQPLLIPDLLAVERALEQAGLLRRAS
ncbi:chemotaxis protein CheW [Halopseudomonas maritima]|uniref:chemotaxis protein CheW n=1 Tax=Halopseudomonas maritima TaxID=2918528 RepID=UPI001EEAF1A5|nr:chemotaxis protein CheW [Halopseudomonas maritima]UJJ30089.1 chemotaxis protein CheW [Halopseudomonas maritima]